MASHPRATQWAQLFALPDQPALPLQARLREPRWVQAILEDHLSAGASLPSLARARGAAGPGAATRVTSAYLQLIDEGFLEARPRSGVFVARNAPARGGAGRTAGGTAAGNRASRPTGRRACCARWWTSRRCPSPSAGATIPIPFVYGQHDPLLFPTEDFRECCARSLARSQLQHWTPDFETDDVLDLIEQIRTRLLPKRGVFALKEEIIVTLGAQHAYYLLADTLFDTHTRVGLEEPGHPHARNSFSAAPAQVGGGGGG